MPGLPYFFADGIVTVLELVKDKGVQFFGVDFAAVVKNGLVSENAYDFTDHMVAVNLHSVFYYFAFKGKGEFFYNGGVYLLAFYCG